MSKFTNPLNNISVASPCSANWDEMYGNIRQRHCGECRMNVYNLSEMTKQDAENLIMNAEGRLCARFYRRADGTVITKDCPVGWKAFKKNVSRFWTATASIFLATVSGIGITNYLSKSDPDPVIMGAIAVETPQTVPNNAIIGEIEPNNIEDPKMIMGDIAYPNDQPQEVQGRIALTK